MTKSEATPGDRFDLRMSGQLEEPCLLNERQATLFLISSLMKQVLKSPNTSTMSNDLISKFQRRMQTTSIDTLYHMWDSETHALENGNVERHVPLTIEDRVQCQMCFEYRRPGETICTCGRYSRTNDYVKLWLRHCVQLYAQQHHA